MVEMNTSLIFQTTLPTFLGNLITDILGHHNLVIDRTSYHEKNDHTTRTPAILTLINQTESQSALYQQKYNNGQVSSVDYQASRRYKCRTQKRCGVLQLVRVFLDGLTFVMALRSAI